MSEIAYVCADCFSDYAIREFIAETVVDETCSFCQRTSSDPIASELGGVIDFIDQGLLRAYEMINDGSVPWDQEEGEYMCNFDLDTWDVVGDELDFPNDANGKLEEAINNGLGIDRTWVPRNPMELSEKEWLTQSWKEFCKHIIRKERFFFREELPEYDRRDPIHPARMMDALAHTCYKCETIDILEGPVWRVRELKGEQTLSNVTEIGPTPTSKAVKDNRMSPVGIVMFYGAFDPETAIAETVDPPCRVAIGKFKVLTPIQMLDLTNIPQKSLFDPEWGHAVGALKFLQDFALAISKPVEKDHSVHRDYVPTQVVTEFFRRVDRNVEGIIYPSSRRPGHSALVIFADQNSVVDCSDEDGDVDAQKILELDGPIEHFDLPAAWKPLST